MVDEELQNDEINLDDFNFDDLPDMSEDTTGNDVGETSGDFDLGDFSFDNMDFGEVPAVDGDDVRKEPFFEAPQEESLSFLGEENEQGENQPPMVEDDALLMEEEYSQPEEQNDTDIVDDVMENEGSDLGESIVEEPEDAGETLSDTSGVVEEPEDTGETPSDTSGVVEDFLVGDYEPASENQDADVVVENNFDNENSLTETETDTEAAFVDEIPEETPLNDEVSFSADEAEEAHGEYFGNEQPIVDETDIFSDLETSEEGVGGTDYSAISSIEESSNFGFAKWYSGQSGVKMFEIAKGFESGSVDADEECKTLHINVGYDTYGWEVQFSDGVVMNLRDVREYQIRNGRLPNPDGRVIYGRSSLLFSGLERIVIYESVKYFSYGV